MKQQRYCVAALVACAILTMWPGANVCGQARRVIPAVSQRRTVEPAVMQRVYEEAQTPFKYGVILKGEEGKKLDCPSVFRSGDTWYMVYIIFDGDGYETALAESDDLLH